MKNIAYLLAIFLMPMLVLEGAYASTGTTTNSKVIIKKPIVKKKIVKKVIQKKTTATGSVSTGATMKEAVTYGLNKPFRLGDVEYTILGIRTFDKVGIRNSFSDYKIPKNGVYLMIELTYKNVSETESNTTDIMNIIDGDRMYEMSSEGQVYGMYQMEWDENIKSDNWAGYIPPGIKKNIFISFDVPAKVIDSGVLFINGPWVAGKKVTLKIPLSSFK